MTLRNTTLILALSAFAALAHASPPDWSLDQSVYEINPEMYSAAGDLVSVEKDLPRLKALGVGILWFTPLQTRGVLKAYKSPYCVADYYGMHAPYGGLGDLKSLVKAAHKLGLHVILDWVGNHSAWDNPLIQAHPEFYAHDAQGQIMTVLKYTDIAQFDYSQPGLRAYMIAAMKHWVQEADVDGFRCDMAWKVPVSFWEEARAELEKLKPVFLLAEANEPGYQGSFDADYDWNLMPPVDSSDLIKVAKGREPATLIDKDLAKEKVYDAPPAFFRLRYTSNHDQFNDVGTPGQSFGAADKAMAVLMATLPGKPLLYNGQEIGWEGRYNGARTAWNTPPSPPIDWSGSTRAAWYTGFYSRLMHLYSQVPAASAGSFARLSSDRDCQVYSFVRASGTSKVVVLLNLAPQASAFTLSGPGLAGDYQELFSGAKASLASPLSTTAGPWEYRVYVQGSAGEAWLKSLAKEGPLAPGWDTAATTVTAAPCPTPMVYPTPDPKIVPVVGYCTATKAKASDWSQVDRLVSGMNPDHVAGKFRNSWDAGNLYVEAEITDPSLHAEKSDPWECDSVELYLGTKHDRKPDYGPDDYQYIFTYGREIAFERANRLEGVLCSTSKTAQGWSLKASIPWSTLGMTPTSKTVLGYDLGIDFNQDGSGRQGQLVFHGSAENYHTTMDFSDLKLLPCRSKKKR